MHELDASLDANHLSYVAVLNSAASSRRGRPLSPEEEDSQDVPAMAYTPGVNPLEEKSMRYWPRSHNTAVSLCVTNQWNNILWWIVIDPVSTRKSFMLPVHCVAFICLVWGLFRVMTSLTYFLLSFFENVIGIRCRAWCWVYPRRWFTICRLFIWCTHICIRWSCIQHW